VSITWYYYSILLFNTKCNAVYVTTVNIKYRVYRKFEKPIELHGDRYNIILLLFYNIMTVEINTMITNNNNLFLTVCCFKLIVIVV